MNKFIFIILTFCSYSAFADETIVCKLRSMSMVCDSETQVYEYYSGRELLESKKAEVITNDAPYAAYGRTTFSCVTAEDSLIGSLRKDGSGSGVYMGKNTGYDLVEVSCSEL